ncbi:unnamed protein product [Penicillium egyptiacum]|uniref:SET domain-containing protein n=1 Tax=Penicillium egyptiacum TaxID=1303716 RepID=A0A9W4P0Q1_9EURO|nr:unnamed protein product [Penicillium egyptiacum]
MLTNNTYSKGLECSPTEEETHYLLYYRGWPSSRSMNWMHLCEILNAVQTGPKSDKALRGKAQTLYRLKRFRKSCELFTKLCKKHPEDISAKNNLREAIARLAEQNKGGYNFGKMQEKASKTYPPLLDHATWIGPVTVRQTKSQGRVLCTTEAVKGGDLLLCEKAFAYATEHPSKPRWSSTLHVNSEARTTTRGGQLALASSIIEKLYKTPPLAAAITNLHSLGFKQVSTGLVDGKPVVDTFQVARIVSLDSFGSPTSSRGDHTYNARDASGSPERLHNCGIWPYASMINHSCMSNAHRAFIGDMMIIRAATDPRKHRPDNVIAMALEKSSEYSHNPAKMLIERLTETYPHPLEQVLRLGLWEPLTLIAGVSDSLKQQNEAMEAVGQALAAVGFVLEGGVEGLLVKKWGLAMDNLVVAWIILWRSLLEVAPERAKQAERYARIAYLICVGAEESFDATYGMSLKVAHEPHAEEGQVEGWVV